MHVLSCMCAWLRAGAGGQDEAEDCPPPALLQSWALTVKLILIGHLFTLLIRKETKSSCKAQSQLAVCEDILEQHKRRAGWHTRIY